MSLPSLTQTLIQIPICKGLTEPEAQSVFTIANEVKVLRGQSVFTEGEPGDSLYVLLEGSVEVLKKNGQGMEQSLAKLSDGSVLGEMSLLGGQSARSATARALTDVRMLRVPSAAFTRLLQLDNLGALKIVHNLAQVMSRRLVLMNEKLVDTLDKAPKRKEELQDFQKILSNWAF